MIELTRNSRPYETLYAGGDSQIGTVSCEVIEGFLSACKLSSPNSNSKIYSTSYEKANTFYGNILRTYAEQTGLESVLLDCIGSLYRRGGYYEEVVDACGVEKAAELFVKIFGSNPNVEFDWDDADIACLVNEFLGVVFLQFAHGNVEKETLLKWLTTCFDAGFRATNSTMQQLVGKAESGLVGNQWSQQFTIEVARLLLGEFRGGVEKETMEQLFRGESERFGWASDVAGPPQTRCCIS